MTAAFMERAKAQEEDEFVMPEKMPDVGDWVYFYNRSITNQPPCPALVTVAGNHIGNVVLTAFTPTGPAVSRCLPAGSPLNKTRDVRDNGCWSWDRLDVKKDTD